QGSLYLEPRIQKSPLRPHTSWYGPAACGCGAVPAAWTLAARAGRGQTSADRTVRNRPARHEDGKLRSGEFIAAVPACSRSRALRFQAPDPAREHAFRTRAPRLPGVVAVPVGQRRLASSEERRGGT